MVTNATAPGQIDRLVSLIANGSSPPAWLWSGLWTAVYGLEWNLRAEGNHPHRADLKVRLDKFHDGATQLIWALENDKAVFGALDGPERAGWDAIRATVHSLKELLPFIDAALASIPAGKGRHKHYPQPVAVPHRMCADFVCVAWCETHGKPVPHTSRAAQDACAELWALAGGDPRPHSSGDLRSTKGWRDQLEAAKKSLRTDRNSFARYRKLLRALATE